MALLFVARSASLCKWASDVGLGKHLFKVALAADKDAMKDAITAGWAGTTDWRLIASTPVEELDEDELIARLDQREKIVDPRFYPHIRDAVGIVRVQEANVLNALLVSQAMASADAPLTPSKPKAKDYGEYLLRSVMK